MESNMKKVYVFIVFLCIVSCGPRKYVRNSFRYSQYCYNGTSTGLDSIINIEEYYSSTVNYIQNVGYPAIPKQSSFQLNSLFSKDGLFIYYYSPESQEGDFGRYILCGDTIKAKFIQPPGGAPQMSGNVWFKIINRNAIEQIFFNWGSEKITGEDLRKYQVKRSKDSISPGKFVPFDSVLAHPNTAKNNWLIKRKWFWCDEKQYKEWKKKF